MNKLEGQLSGTGYKGKTIFRIYLLLGRTLNQQLRKLEAGKSEECNSEQRKVQIRKQIGKIRAQLNKTFDLWIPKQLAL
jgi:hypothetical protein